MSPAHVILQISFLKSNKLFTTVGYSTLVNSKSPLMKHCVNCIYSKIRTSTFQKVSKPSTNKNFSFYKLQRKLAVNNLVCHNSTECNLQVIKKNNDSNSKPEFIKSM